MSPIVSYILAAALGAYAIIIVGELIINRALRRFVIEAIVLVAVAVVLNLTTGFPIPSSRVAFGGVSPVLAIVVMFVCVVLGIAAHLVFFQKGRLAWSAFLKPLVVSPIVLLPLIGSIHGSSDVATIQLISLGLLAFQNGFFWKTVLEHAAPST